MVMYLSLFEFAPVSESISGFIFFFLFFFFNGGIFDNYDIESFSVTKLEVSRMDFFFQFPAVSG